LRVGHGLCPQPEGPCQPLQRGLLLQVGGGRRTCLCVLGLRNACSLPLARTEDRLAHLDIGRGQLLVLGTQALNLLMQLWGLPPLSRHPLRVGHGLCPQPEGPCQPLQRGLLLQVGGGRRTCLCVLGLRNACSLPLARVCSRQLRCFGRCVSRVDPLRAYPCCCSRPLLLQLSPQARELLPSRSEDWLAHLQHGGHVLRILLLCRGRCPFGCAACLLVGEFLL